MYDTIAIRSPILSYAVAEMIMQECQKKMAVDVGTGELLYELTTGQLEGSYDGRISIRLDDGIFRRKEDENVTRKVKDGYRLIVEASVWKMKQGHNIYGGMESFQESVKYLLQAVEKIINISLPDYKEWEVRRIDYANNFNLGSPEAVRDWFYQMSFMHYSRRKPSKFGLDGLYFKGSTTTLKFYHKGADFKVHDRKKIIARYGVCFADKLQEIADNILRCEIEIRPRKLKYDFNLDIIKVRDIKDSYVKRLMDVEVEKVMKEGKEMKIVRNAYDVERRLISVYGERKARLLMSTWFQLTTFGVEKVKESMTKPTYYRHVKELKEACVSWNNTDVKLEDSRKCPVDFVPYNDSKYKMQNTEFYLVAV